MISIIDITRGQIKFKYNDRECRILGEMLIRDIGGLDYILYENSFNSWDPPFENEQIDQAQKKSYWKSY